MADLDFEVNLRWQGTGRDGEGQAQIAEETTVTYSAPSSMGGKGVGTSPEQLLIAAVSTCYSSTLFGILRKEQLQVAEVTIRAVGQVQDYPLKSKFAQLTVYPTIYGADTARAEDYQLLAEKARDKCFIGKTIVGNVTYSVGQVTLAE